MRRREDAADNPQEEVERLCQDWLSLNRSQMFKTGAYIGP